MHLRRHPLSGALYDVDTNGMVRVDDHGTTGVFTAQGDWVSGDLRHADAHLCGWLAGIQPHGKGVNPKDLPSTAGAEPARPDTAGIRDLATIVRDGVERQEA